MLLVEQPEVSRLLRSANDETRAAIAELRDLARGIAPPVLADRGLAAAVEALASRSAGEVTVHADLDRRLAPVVEGAAYFVVCEALANAARHAPGAPVELTLALHDDLLRVTIRDEGPGGADPAGSGLTGLRHASRRSTARSRSRARPAAPRSSPSCRARDPRRVASEAWRAAGCRSGSSS